VLALRGVKKQSVVAYPGTDVRYSNGYRTEDKQAILNDLGLLELCYVRGKCTVCINGRWQTFFVDSEYLHSSVVYRQTIWGEEVAGLFVNVGDWINAYEASGNSYLAEVERSIFRLNPQNEQHELRLALYLGVELRKLFNHCAEWCSRDAQQAKRLYEMVVCITSFWLPLPSCIV
jgi:hypothetical protein